MLPYLELDQHWEVATIEPIASWCKGRVTLLGDSAHAMVQALAQGACQAVEDALSLAENISASPHDLDSAFLAFNRSRLLRVTRVQYMSRLMWEIIHVRGAYAKLRNERLKTHDNVLEALSWLYESDVSGTEKSAVGERAA
jgi:salicylate hydroxylase